MTKKREGIGDRRRGGKAPMPLATGGKNNSFKSAITGLEDHTFEYGSPKHVAKFAKSQKQIANFIQKNTTKEEQRLQARSEPSLCPT